MYTAQVDTCTVYYKKYCGTGIPLYRSTGIGFKKFFFEYSFYYTQEKLFLKHTTCASPAHVTDKKIHQPSEDI
jgi:hypothetical protein